MFNLSKIERLTQLFIDFKGGVEIKVSFPMGNLCNSSTIEHNYTDCLVHMVDLSCDLICLLGFFCSVLFCCWFCFFLFICLFVFVSGIFSCSQEGYRLQPHFPCGVSETCNCRSFAGLDFGETRWTKDGFYGHILCPQRYASS